ncbi:hypothetical protein N1851_029837 [Merluccius polli]|uniref:Uncharacterized protein n=1 Tax=Merluccius polli TaxID=89951 RepID=A0AA47NQH6_MERPO|nr:hypothetical protein N1851_029837 [Merluccius polli]
MAATVDALSVCPNIVLCAIALLSSYQLFKDHRAPSLAFFLLGLSAVQCTLSPFCPGLAYLQNELEWASEIMVSSLVAFDLLWLSEDHNTAHILLCGSFLFLGLSDCLSADTLVLMTHCLGLSSLSCSLTVCLFSNNGLGAVGSLALSLPSLVGIRVGVEVLSPLLSPVASEGLIKWILKGSLSLGCWAATWGLNHFLLEVRTWD